jgi:hypothetical protein
MSDIQGVRVGEGQNWHFPLKFPRKLEIPLFKGISIGISQGNWKFPFQRHFHGFPIGSSIRQLFKINFVAELGRARIGIFIRNLGPEDWEFRSRELGPDATPIGNSGPEDLDRMAGHKKDGEGRTESRTHENVIARFQTLDIRW